MMTYNSDYVWEEGPVSEYFLGKVKTEYLSQDQKEKYNLASLRKKEYLAQRKYIYKNRSKRKYGL